MTDKLVLVECKLSGTCILCKRDVVSLEYKYTSLLSNEHRYESQLLCEYHFENGRLTDERYVPYEEINWKNINKTLERYV